MLKISEFRTPTPQDVREKKGSKILKLPPVRNCFTLAVTNWLSSYIVLKYQKLRNFCYMKWNFLYQITAASRTLDYGLGGGYRHPDPRSQSSTEFVEPPPPPTKFLGTPLLLDISLHYFISRINWVNKTSKKKEINWFGEPHPFPERGSPTSLSASVQQRYEGWSFRMLATRVRCIIQHVWCTQWLDALRTQIRNTREREKKVHTDTT